MICSFFFRLLSTFVQRIQRKDRIMNLLSYILEIQFIIKMSMP